MKRIRKEKNKLEKEIMLQVEDALQQYRNEKNNNNATK